MTSPIDPKLVSPTEQFIQTTVRIDNQWGSTGTGFIVVRQTDEQHGRGFVVTNKHVLWGSESDKNLVEEIAINGNVRISALPEQLAHQVKTGAVSRDIARIEFLRKLRNNDGSWAWREHPDPDVDVVAVDVTEFVGLEMLHRKWVNYEILLDEDKRVKHDIKIGDEVVAVGYPSSGIGHYGSNLPLMRRGIIASCIGDTLEDEVKGTDCKWRKRLARGFLVDGAIIPGSSGSPVFLAPVLGRFVHGKAILGAPPVLVAGIISETRLARVQGDTFEGLTYAGLGLAFDAETIKETVELFFEKQV